MSYNEYLDKHSDKAFICHLPCKVGDMVYMRYDTNLYTSVCTCTVRNFNIADFTVELSFGYGEYLSYTSTENLGYMIQLPTKFSISEFGKTLFLDKSEAEAQ